MLEKILKYLKVIQYIKEKCYKILFPDHYLTEHKKGTETSVNPEEDQGVEDHDEL